MIILKRYIAHFFCSFLYLQRFSILSVCLKKYFAKSEGLSSITSASLCWIGRSQQQASTRSARVWESFCQMRISSMKNAFLLQQRCLISKILVLTFWINSVGWRGLRTLTASDISIVIYQGYKRGGLELIRLGLIKVRNSEMQSWMKISHKDLVFVYFLYLHYYEHLGGMFTIICPSH